METLDIPSGSKEEIYKALLPQVKSIFEGEDDIVANMANLTAILSKAFGFLWTGFYIVKNAPNLPEGKRLVLGPFQGPLACTSILYGKGVCGTAWKRMETIIVPDVDQFPGHIACSSESRSEIVVPMIINENVIAVLDIDSKELSTFDSVDAHYLQQFLTFLHQV